MVASKTERPHRTKVSNACGEIPHKKTVPGYVPLDEVGWHDGGVLPIALLATKTDTVRTRAKPRYGRTARTRLPHANDSTAVSLRWGRLSCSERAIEEHSCPPPLVTIRAIWSFRS